MKRLIEAYSRFVAYNSGKILVAIIILSVLAVFFAGRVGEKSVDNRDTLPEDLDVLEAFDVIEDSFGGSESVMIAIQVDPRSSYSNEIRDLRDPEAIRYMHLLTQLSGHTDDVISTNSLSTMLVHMNNGVLPKRMPEIREMVETNPMSSQYINDDYSLAIIRLTLSDSYEADELVDDLQNTVEQIQKPAGLTAELAGSIVTDPIIMEQIGPDMQRTSQFSLIGIIVVLLLLFLSVRYALIPLLVIGLGITWAFGYFGILGIQISPQTSGAISMIMGIGIDFGIQTVSRFRQELRSHGPRKSMDITLNNVLMPMATTTLAALIGFTAMSMGQLTVLQELGNIMSIGVAACFFAAITVVPVVAVLSEQAIRKLKGDKR